jgi:hypothetical protein
VVLGAEDLLQPGGQLRQRGQLTQRAPTVSDPAARPGA